MRRRGAVCLRSDRRLPLAEVAAQKCLIGLVAVRHSGEVARMVDRDQVSTHESELLASLWGRIGERLRSTVVEDVTLVGEHPCTEVVFKLRPVRGIGALWSADEWRTRVWEAPQRPSRFGLLHEDELSDPGAHAADVVYHFNDSWLPPGDPARP